MSTMNSFIARWIRAKRVAAAIRCLQSIGGSVRFAHEWDQERDRISQAPPPGSWLLRKMLGDLYYFVPDVFLLSNFTGKVSQLEPLKVLTPLTNVGIVDSALGDEMLPILQALPNIEHLSLFGTQVTDAVFGSLMKLDRLQSLVVTKTNVSALGVAEFRRLKARCITYVGDGLADPAAKKKRLKVVGQKTNQAELTAVFSQIFAEHFNIEEATEDTLLLTSVDLDAHTDCFYLEGTRALIEYTCQQHGFDQTLVSIEAA